MRREPAQRMARRGRSLRQRPGCCRRCLRPRSRPAPEVRRGPARAAPRRAGCPAERCGSSDRAWG
ncbi:hypothetical protein EMQ25_07425 [Arsenicitalea aurantiaca]|uniref:Uncharacterized protein n=1 Tax=Arsenicitalea aurantiaca TaxID=1783274 RepID=A0A433XGH2_9HYPH|nr:hypothetical protein EMQ25_07425 [Arsenicitalea aurantiaca]